MTDDLIKALQKELREADARIAELEAENEELKKAISKPWMGSARAAYLGETE
jgi:cell division protein FtsB